MTDSRRNTTTRNVTLGPLWRRLRLLGVLGLAACEGVTPSAGDPEGLELSRAALTGPAATSGMGSVTTAAGPASSIGPLVGSATTSATVGSVLAGPTPHGAGPQTTPATASAIAGGITIGGSIDYLAHLDGPNAIAVVSAAPGRLDLFARASDGALLTKRIDGSVEHSWESLGGDIASAPTAVSPAAGQIEVFARGRKGELFRRSHRQGSWGDWESLGGALQGAPSAASWGGGRVDVFVRAIDNRMFRRVMVDGRWQPWESLGGALAFDPVATSGGPGRIDVVVRDGSRQLMHRHLVGGVWSPWRAEGGILTTDPSLTSPEGGRLELVGRNTDNALVARSFSGGAWGPWRTLGDRIDSVPTLVAGPGGRLDVVARAPENRLFRRTFSSGTWGVPRLSDPIVLEPAWGVADLHTHPASHLSFGAGASGGGIMWGSPGLALDHTGASVTRDLPPCPQDKHVHGDTDWVRHVTRSSVINTVNSITGHPHGNGSDGGYTNWPHALSLSHQQMHVSFLHRAHQGGVRLVFASVTDNQTLSMLWHRHLDWSHDMTMPRPGPADDYQSARRQLEFIQQLAAANPTWLEVVTTPQAARAALRGNRLALVLALELDKLTVDQILALKREFGVASVIPVHLADNAFGGAAVYSEPFNTNNWYLNGSFFQVRGNPLLSFRLTTPTYLRIEYQKLWERGAVTPRAWEDRSQFCSVLGYEPCQDLRTTGIPWTQGHENIMGISRANSRRLLEAGLMVDVSHMGAQSTEEMLTLAEEFDYPLIASHGGLRGDAEKAESERSLLASHALRLSRLGGVLGLGTEGQVEKKVLSVDVGAPAVRLTGDRRSWTRSLAPANDTTSVVGIPRLWVTVRTGGDDLRGGNDNAQAVVTYRDRGGVLRTLPAAPLNGTQRWGDNTTNTAWVHLPAGTQAADIESFAIVTSLGGGIGGDNWNVDDLKVVYEVGGRVQDLFRRVGTPFFRFTGDRRTFTERFARPHPMQAPLRSLDLTVITGGDDLRGGNDNAYATVTFTDGVRIESAVNGGARLADNGTHRARLTLREGTTLADVKSVSMRTTFGGEAAGDNWNVDEMILDYATDHQSGTLVRKVGAPYVRFTNNRQNEVVYVKPADPVSLGAPASVLRIVVRTGDDDLRAGSQASFTVGMRSGNPVTVKFNEGGLLPNGSTFSRIVRLPTGTKVADLSWLRIDNNGSGVSTGESYDNWNIDQVDVEVLTDPLATWIKEYLQVRRTTAGAGLALGTDLNGFAKQMPFTTRLVPGNMTVARDRAPASVRPSVPVLGRHRLGATRVFDFSQDGIAHYGMLPDFLQALVTSPEGEHAVDAEGAQVVDTLLRSAEDTIRAWELAGMARARVVGPTP